MGRVGWVGQVGQMGRVGRVEQVGQVRQVGVRAKASECMELGMWGRLWDGGILCKKNFAKRL